MTGNVMEQASSGDPDRVMTLETVDHVEETGGEIVLPVDHVSEAQIALERARGALLTATSRGRDTGMAADLYKQARKAYLKGKHEEVVGLLAGIWVIL